MRRLAQTRSTRGIFFSWSDTLFPQWRRPSIRSSQPLAQPTRVALAPSAALGTYRGTPLLVDAAGVRLDLRLDLRGISSMGALQAAVAAAVGAASPGGLARLGALSMEYVPESGPARTVTQAVPFATIRAARELRLRASSAARARPPPRVARSEVGTRSTGRGTGLD